MDRAEALRIVSRQGWLADQPEGFRTRFLSQATFKTVEANRVLFEAGDFNGSFIGLAEGSIAISWDHPQLSRHLIHFARPIFWIGDGLAYGLPNRLVSAHTKTKVHLIAVSRKNVEDLIAEDPRRLAYFGRLTILHVEACLKMIGELMYRDPLIRLSARLATMCNSYTASKPSGAIEVDITQDDLANLLNLSRKTLNRALGTLRAHGVVASRYGHVTILDFERLCDVASAREHLVPLEVDRPRGSLLDPDFTTE